MELVQIHPIGFIWGGMALLWVGFCSAYLNRKECRAIVNGLGILLGVTGTFLFGVVIGTRGGFW